MGELKTLRVRMKFGYYVGEIRELERSAALELLRLERVELVDTNSLTPEELKMVSPAIGEVTSAPLLAGKSRR
jgi:hypothetical protein